MMFRAGAISVFRVGCCERRDVDVSNSFVMRHIFSSCNVEG
jgi:hypothetical protein